MRNLILSLVITIVSILNLSAQNTIITNVRNMVIGVEDMTERIDYTIVIDNNFTKVQFIGKKKNTSFEIELVSLEEEIVDGNFKLLTFNTKFTDKLTILYNRNEISIVTIEKDENTYTNFLFSDIANNFPKAKK